MKPSKVTQGPEVKKPEKIVGKLGERAVTEGKITEEKRKFRDNCAIINILDVKNRGIFTRIREAILGATQEEIDAFKEVEKVVNDLSKRSDLDLSDLKNKIQIKKNNKEYNLESDDAKLLKKALLIDAQTKLGVVDAAKKTEAFYKFDVVIESKTKESVDVFKKYLEKLGIEIGPTKNAGLYDSLEDVINKKVETQEDFTDPEIKSIRNSIFTALQNKKMETDHAALFQKMSVQHEKDEFDIANLQNEQQNLRTVLSSAAETAKRNEETVRTGERKIADLQKERTALQDENTGLKSTVEKQKAENSQLNDDVHSLNKARQDYIKYFNDLAKNLSLMVELRQDKLNQANKEIGQFKLDKAKLEDFITNLKNQIVQAKQQNEVLQTENSRLTKVESDHKLLQQKTQGYEEKLSELSNFQGAERSLKAKTEKLANLDKQLADAENKRKEMEGLVSTRAQELERIEATQAKITEHLDSIQKQWVMLGILAGATIPEEMKPQFALNIGDSREINELLSKEELTPEEVNQLKSWTNTLMLELNYENQLMKKVPDPIGDLKTQFADPNRGTEDAYLNELKTKLQDLGYPELITSDADPRVFVFFVDGELSTVEVGPENPEENILVLQEHIDACRARAEDYNKAK